MKVNGEAVDAVIEKVNRAHHHFVVLTAETKDWNGRRPTSLRHEVRNGGARHDLRLDLDEPIPVSWSVRLGEGVHDLRSAPFT